MNNKGVVNSLLTIALLMAMVQSAWYHYVFCCFCTRDNNNDDQQVEVNLNINADANEVAK